jgi:putative transposase
MKNKLEVLTPDCTYHIYNRANGNEQLFLNNENYRYFLQQYMSYIQPIADTFCYCLMPNHFHFLVRIKSEKELVDYFGAFPKFKTLENKNLTGFQNLGLDYHHQNLEKLISQLFSNLLNSYAKAFNKQYNRKGSLFMRPFKRIKVSDEHYRQKLVHYIHNNPLEARLCKRMEDWKYSSYSVLISNTETLVRREVVLEWFEDLENFRYVHLYPSIITGID